MPTLNWIGKEKIVAHHQDVPFHVPRHKYGFTADGGRQDEPTHSGNMIIHGDNLVALKSLLPQYEGRIDCIYIDPPYNTGNESWVYNDNVNEPHIKKWLNEVVGKQGEDLSRHDKWLSMMYPRLMLLHKLLSPTGAIFISIDDNAQAFLKELCDEIFGRNNFVAQVVWQKRTSPDARKTMSTGHEYILFYVRDYMYAHDILNPIPFDEEDYIRYQNPDNDPNGPWCSTDCTAQAGHGTKEQFYDMVTPGGRVIKLQEGLCWRYTKKKMEEEVVMGHIWFGADGNGVPRKKTYLKEREGKNAWTWWPNKEVGHTQEATKETAAILGKNATFDYPKPVRLIQRVIQLATKKDSIVLDSFAGSGTTAQAVMQQNNKDKGNRKFILVEMMDYAETITAERVRRVAQGYPYKGKKEEEIYSRKLTPKNILQADKLLKEAEAAAEAAKGEYDKISNPKIEDNCLKVIGTKVYDGEMPGLGGAFDFYELGEKLFDDDGFLNERVGEDKIRQYIFYSETGQPMQEDCRAVSPYLLGCCNKTDFYFYYDPKAETCFCPETADLIVRQAEQYIVYADTCLFSKEELARRNIIFKKIPRDIKRF